MVGSSDWSGTDQSGRGVLRSCQTERSDWSGTDQSAREVLLSCQKKPSDWSGEQSVLIGVCMCVRIFARSVPIGREPTNRDAEFFGAVKRSIPIGREF